MGGVVFNIPLSYYILGGVWYLITTEGGSLNAIVIPPILYSPFSLVIVTPGRTPNSASLATMSAGPSIEAICTM